MKIISIVSALCATALLSAQPAPVLTRSADNQRHGAYVQETVLAPHNVAGLKPLYTIAIPGDQRGIEGQPLVAPAVKLTDNTTHDLLVVATMADDVIAYDFANGHQLWRTHIGKPVTGSKAIDMWQINDHWGVISTGVIDAATQTLYVVAWSSPDGTPQKGAFSLHAIALNSGKEIHPALSLQSVRYDAGHGLPVQTFGAQMRKQRSALLLQTIAGHKVVFFASGTVLETDKGASGWVLAVDVSDWRITAAWATTARFFGGGIWMGGQGLAADPNGDLYAITGNGSFDATTDFSECFLRLHYTPPASSTKRGKLAPIDWWSPFSDAGRIGKSPILPTPHNLPAAPAAAKPAGVNKATEHDLPLPVNAMSGHAAMAAGAAPALNEFDDQDLGSGGVVVIPEMGIVGGAGKDGVWYSVNEGNMGKTKPADFANPAANYAKLKAPPIWFTFFPGFSVDPKPQDVTKLNFFFDNRTHHMHSTPVLFRSAHHGSMLFCWGENGNLRAWTINANGTLNFLANSAEVASPDAPVPHGGMPGGMIALSANGTSNGVVWAIVPLGDANRTKTGGVVYAYDAENFDQFPDGSKQLRLLWHSSIPFLHPKFNVPVVTGGRVIVPTYDARVIVFGL
jgi:hypothetical protein